jgi:tetratricopeptide (TPR) repeat protein
VALGMLAETNPRRRSQIISTALLVLLLFTFSGITLSQQTGLHAMQARYLEGQQNWQTAVTEYQLAGEVAPASDNLARIYNEWGEALSRQQRYADAVAKFGTVLKTYKGATAQVTRARTDTVSVYLAWGKYASLRQDYTGATAAYDTLLKLDYCSSNCQSQAQTVDATAYYNLAEQQLSLQQYTASVSAFNVLTTRFSHALEVAQVHADYAKALWGLGQQQLNTTCSDAVKTYQQLAGQFGDTGQGKQAASDLQQPVTVKGQFTTPVPGAPYNPTVALVQGLYVGIPVYLFPPILREAPMVPVNSDGTFTFNSVPQGTYELVWSYDGKLHYYYAYSGTQVLYKANLGPLCTYNYGGINETIPT